MSSDGVPDPVPSIDVAEARIASALVDPGISYWVKDALISVRDRDPVDAAEDAAMLARLLGDRVDAILIVVPRGQPSSALRGPVELKLDRGG